MVLWPLAEAHVRLAAKYAAALSAAVGLVLVGESVLNVKRVAELQRKETRDELHVFGEEVSAAVTEIWRLAGKDAALAYVRRADARRPLTSIRIHEGPPQADRPLPSTAEASLVHNPSAAVAATVPLKLDDIVVAAIELHREVPDERRYLRLALAEQAQTTFVALGISIVVAYLLGFWLLGQPVRMLLRGVQKVSNGDFTYQAPIPKTQDELRRLTVGMNAMVRRLADSKARESHERQARTEALEQLRHADRLTTVGRLASSMAHELGTPLNVVSGHASMIAGDVRASPDTLTSAVVIKEQAVRMTAIIRELLDFSRRQPLELAETKIRRLLEHAVTLIEPLCEKAEVQLRVHGALDVTAMVDAGKALQVVTNLLVNAVHAMPHGGEIRLDVSREHVADPPDRHAAAHQDFVRIDVTDQGVGIPAAQLDDVFRPFFTTDKAGKGTGLGLSICHDIVREHGGWITVESCVGVGTSFHVYLPEQPTLPSAGSTLEPTGASTRSPSGNNDVDDD